MSLKDKVKRIEYHREYYKYNLDKWEKQKIDKKKFPWKYVLKGIKTRCNNSKCKRYKDYGGRGIKCLITQEEVKKLWFRDKAYLLKRPSIDREDNDGHYKYSNCRFIELKENLIKGNKETHIKTILQFDLHENFLIEWRSIGDASKFYNCHISAISNALRIKTKTSCGFIWRYQNA